MIRAVRTLLTRRFVYYRLSCNNDARLTSTGVPHDMVTISAFADEISQDLDEQLAVMESENVRHIELRSVWDTGSLRLSDDQREKIKATMDERGFKVSSIATGLGKYDINDDFGRELDDCQRAVDTAKFFGCDNIRLFSYWDKKGGDVLNRKDEVLSRMARLTEVAAKGGVILGHENEKGIYGEKPEECREILDFVDSPYLKAIFDPANFIQAGVKPFEEAWSLLKDDVVYFHVKDAMLETGKVTPAGDGDGRLPEIFRDKIVDGGWEGVLSLEPHLSVPSVEGEPKGAASFRAAVGGLRNVLDNLNIEYC
jgi:3-dehydroshikimate dehydratase